MARKSSTKAKEEIEDTESGLSDEVKRGIAVLCLGASAVLIFLAFFGVAGKFGGWIETGLSYTFGWDRFLVPLMLIVICVPQIFPEKGRFTKWNYLGFVIFFLTFNGLINTLLMNKPEPVITDVTLAGGYIGQILSVTLYKLIGFWGSLVFLVAGLVSSVMLTFNTSLRSIFTAHRHITGLFGEQAHLKSLAEEIIEEEEFEEEQIEEEEEEEENEPEEEDEEEEATKPKRRKKTTEDDSDDEMPEMVLTTKRRRMVTIPIDLLDHRISKAQTGDVEENKEIISSTFHQFGVDVEMDATATGPTVTQYTLRPSKGVKLAKIINLQNDLALALAAHPIRIEAPIPGKSLVGIEVPNEKVATVSLRELLESKEFAMRKTPLSVPLGKDVGGKVDVISIEKMPHLLVAGATGSGKSVCVNTFIISLLYQNGPDDLKFIMVDPKRVELTAYEGIPHLLTPPITKVEDTVNALKWTVREMERRLDVLSKFGARDIISYNEKAEEKMPKIVVIIDELADLMTTSGREVETSIVRIAQMARATGIHLILATQRPSVDVITGIIKANIPGRIAFSVASQTDSRTILDISGAEKLLGRGDMLHLSAELSKPKRVQGAFVSEDEVTRVVDFLKEKGTPDYNYAITESPKGTTIFDSSDDDDDPLLDDAVKILLDAQKASTSLLQRRLKIGYSRAARIIDILEDKGVVGPNEGSKPREILIEEWPIGGSIKNGMPTADDDYEEAGEDYEDEEEEEEIEDEELDLIEDADIDTEDNEEEDDNDYEESEEDNEEEETDNKKNKKGFELF